MGIRGMNRFMRTFCSEAIRTVRFNELYGKKISVDMSVYMYRFKKEKTLVADMFTLMYLFKENNITPVFVFDGEPPKEKEQEMKERRKLKEVAIEKYEAIKKELAENAETYDEVAKEEKKKEMAILEREFVSLKNSDLRKMCRLIDGFGFARMFAVGEADMLCAALEKSGMVDAVMSEDGDMVAYGCTVVLRSPSITAGTCELFDVGMARKMLGVSVETMRHMCVLSGTDYNAHIMKGRDNEMDSSSSKTLIANRHTMDTTDAVDATDATDASDDSDGDATLSLDFFQAYTIMSELRGGTTVQDLSTGCVPYYEMNLLDEMLRIKKIDEGLYGEHIKTANLYALSISTLRDVVEEYADVMKERSEFNKAAICECLNQNGVLVCV